MVVLAICFLGNKWLSNIAVRDKAKATTDQQAVVQQQIQNKQLADQIQQQTNQYQQLIAALSQENAQLASAMQNRTVVLQQQQTTDKTLPMPDLGNRWTALAQLQPGDLTATPSGITVTPQGAVATVMQLEQVPVLQQNLKDETTVAGNQQKQIDSSTQLIAGLDQQVTGLNMQIIEQDKTCKAQITAVKASARSSKWHWFLRGLGIGGAAVGAIAVHVW